MQDYDYFCKGVDTILDIGGQDMKCLKIKDGTIESILLNVVINISITLFQLIILML
mgnify:CR=1 FL=1